MSLKILVADDSVTIQKIISLAFREDDALIETASDGDNAMDLVHTFEPDVVLVDVFLPGCNGYEICARIKDDPELEKTPVLLLVGAFEAFDAAAASRVKSDGFLTKPFDMTELLQTVRDLADKGVAARSLATRRETRIMNDPTSENMQPGIPDAGVKGLISPETYRSFLGADRVLDLFDSHVFQAAETALSADAPRRELEELMQNPSAIKPGVSLEDLVSEGTMNAIVDRVVRRISADAIREVAWEVVPELSESIIRSTIEEQRK
jgi:CheY-like chemotaxis protein